LAEPPSGPGRDPAPAEAGGSSLGEMLSTAVKSAAALLAGKLRLAELELSRDLTGLRTGLVLVLVSLLLFLLTLGFAGAGAAILLGKAIDSPGQATLIVAGAYLLGGVAALAAARRRLRSLRNILQESRADLKRDVEWLKNLP
jgi:uncharacterized membrane protein YqjE